MKDKIHEYIKKNKEIKERMHERSFGPYFILHLVIYLRPTRLKIQSTVLYSDFFH